MVHDSNTLKHIDFEALRRGSQFSMQQRKEMVSPIFVAGIEKALHRIGDLKSLGADGYN